MKRGIDITALFLIFATLLPLSSCTGAKIKEKTMAKIISDVYLADQWLKGDADSDLRADSLLIYEPIFNGYGYTLTDYLQSMEYYIQNGRKYKRLLNDSQRILEEGLESTEATIARQNYFRTHMVGTPLSDTTAEKRRDWEVLYDFADSAVVSIQIPLLTPEMQREMALADSLEKIEYIEIKESIGLGKSVTPLPPGEDGRGLDMIEESEVTEEALPEEEDNKKKVDEPTTHKPNPEIILNRKSGHPLRPDNKKDQPSS